MFVSAGREWGTTDLGAAESVVPRHMLQHEVLVKGSRKKSDVNYVAANCGE